MKSFLKKFTYGFVFLCLGFSQSAYFMVEEDDWSEEIEFEMGDDNLNDFEIVSEDVNNSDNNNLCYENESESEKDYFNNLVLAGEIQDSAKLKLAILSENVDLIKKLVEKKPNIVSLKIEDCEFGGKYLPFEYATRKKLNKNIIEFLKTKCEE